MKLEEIIRTGLSRVDTIAVKRTAINPALWLVGPNYSPVARFDRYNWRPGRAVDTVLLRCGPSSFYVRSLCGVYVSRPGSTAVGRIQGQATSATVPLQKGREYRNSRYSKPSGSDRDLEISAGWWRERMKTFLLVFDDGSSPEIDLRRYVDSLDSGAEMYTLDGHVCFLKSDLSVSDLSGRLLRFSGSSLFFIVDVTSSEYEGRMLGVFWDFLKSRHLESAAE
jgi:hypothetical protein